MSEQKYSKEVVTQLSDLAGDLTEICDSLDGLREGCESGLINFNELSDQLSFVADKMQFLLNGAVIIQKNTIINEPHLIQLTQKMSKFVKSIDLNNMSVIIEENNVLH
ncbi:MAG: hypothetical protein H8E61_00230 [Bacteroidetes bacterium]|nr:hypothetical protein [Bacteroidota bacterium]